MTPTSARLQKHSSIPPLDRKELLHRLAPLLRQCDGRLILFGSRARGNSRTASDIDLAVRAAQPIPAHLLAAARQALEDSRIPFRVDLLDYATLSSAMREAIDLEGIPWTD